MGKFEQGITYKPEMEKERLPFPKFPEAAYWQGIPEEGEIVGQHITLNGDEFVFEVVGFQGSEGAGFISMHQEKTQREGAYFISGEGMMTKWSGIECQRRADEPVSWDRPLHGILSPEEAKLAKYTLAVASEMSGSTEILVLNIETAGGRTIPLQGEWLPIGWSHGTQLYGKTLYFVVKMSRHTSDTHEMVGFAGPYGGGSDG